MFCSSVETSLVCLQAHQLASVRASTPVCMHVHLPDSTLQHKYVLFIEKSETEGLVMYLVP